MLDVDVFELGAELSRWEAGKLTPVDGAIFDSFARHTGPMTRWVRENIAELGPESRRATAERLVQAPTLTTVLEGWVERIKGYKRDASEPVILAAHNGWAVDWTVTYWCMVKAGMDAYGILRGLGVLGVLDTERLAKHLPERAQAKLSLTAGGKPSFANKSLVTGLLGVGEDSYIWHRAVDDARATARVLRCGAMAALLRAAHRDAEQMSVLVSLEQLVLKVHHTHNERVKKAAPGAPPAGKERKKSVCTYCNGQVLPAHATRRTCPKRIADEAAEAAAAATGAGSSRDQAAASPQS